MLAKELTFIAHADSAGIVLGAKVPVILTSRADNEKARLASCAVAVLYRAWQHSRRQGTPGGRMTPHLLTLNAGSSSLKFALFEAEGKSPGLLAKGQVEALGASPHLILCSEAGDKLEDRAAPENAAHAHKSALQHILDTLKTHFPAMYVEAVGHRVVHGGPRYAEPLRLTREVIAELEEFIPLAPLHQPHNLSGIEAAQRSFPDAMQIACFDTAFHRAHPWVNDTFALPRDYYEKGVRRYGFHGLSYEYVAGKLQETAPDAAAGRAVIAHLGAGASMCGDQERPERGLDHGFLAAGRLAHGHALRAARPWRGALSSWITRG